MPAAPADSALFSGLLGDAETARFFTDEASLAAMIRVEAALAQVQGRLGTIPAASADAIAAACAQMRLSPADLAAATAENGVPVPGLVAAMRKAMGQPDHAQYLHWGATSQDVMDSALALRLREVLDLWETRLHGLIACLGRMARAEAAQPMAARTYGQLATPTSFGAVVAGWGWPLLDHLRDLGRLRRAVLCVSLSGAAGTLSAMGPQGAQIRAGLAEALALHDRGHSWHSDRSGTAALAGWIAGLAASLGKMGEDLLLLTQSGLALVAISGGGASSTMPQKQNPVAPSALVALARHAIGLSAVLTGAGLHRQQRDGAAWFTEWLTLPQICIDAGRMLELAADATARLTPLPEAMRADLEADGGVIHAEALTFALTEAAGLPRPEAAAQVKDLCARAKAARRPLLAEVAEAFPGHDWAALVAARTLGEAPAEARAFARAAGVPEKG